jgi:hypothetical protein
VRYDTMFIAIGLFCLLVGQIFGTWMGIGQNFTFAPAHAHLNLAGGVLLCLYGLLHRSYPALKDAKLARLQAVCAVIGGLALPVGIVLAMTTENIVLGIIGAFGIMLGGVLFLIMFVGKAKTA